MSAHVQEQTTGRVVALATQTSKLTGRKLAQLMRFAIRKMNEERAQTKNTAQLAAGKRGKQSVKALVQQSQGVNSIDIKADETQGIRSFDRIARKYGMDYAVRKDTSVVPPNWTVFFKARDVDALTAAFKEYNAELGRRTVEKEKPSLLERLHQRQMEIRNKAPQITRNIEQGAR